MQARFAARPIQSCATRTPLLEQRILGFQPAGNDRIRNHRGAYNSERKAELLHAAAQAFRITMTGLHLARVVLPSHVALAGEVGQR